MESPRLQLQHPISRRTLLAAVAIAAAGPIAGRAQTPSAEGPGISGSNQYESPAFGYTLRWDAPWQLPADEPAASSENGVDTLVLHHEFRGPGENRLQVTGTAGGRDAEDLDAQMQAWVDQVHATAADENLLILLDATSDTGRAVMYTNPGAFSMVFTLREYRSLADRDCFLDLTLEGGSVAFGDVYRSLQENVFLNEGTPFDLIPSQDILAAYELAVHGPATPQPIATP